MGTAEAILKLREKAGVNQEQLAKLLGIGARSVSRYEGGYEPGPKVLKELADLAAVHNLNYLRDIFATKMRGDIVSQVEKLPSTGSARRIPLRELQGWAQGLYDVSLGLAHFSNLLRRMGIELDQKENARLQNMIVKNDSLRYEIGPYIQIPQERAERMAEMETLLGKPPSAETEIDPAAHKIIVGPGVERVTYGPKGLQWHWKGTDEKRVSDKPSKSQAKGKEPTGRRSSRRS